MTYTRNPLIFAGSGDGEIHVAVTAAAHASTPLQSVTAAQNFAQNCDWAVVLRQYLNGYEQTILATDPSMMLINYNRSFEYGAIDDQGNKVSYPQNIHVNQARRLPEPWFCHSSSNAVENNRVCTGGAWKWNTADNPGIWSLAGTVYVMNGNVTGANASINAVNGTGGAAYPATSSAPAITANGWNQFIAQDVWGSQVIAEHNAGNPNVNGLPTDTVPFLYYRGYFRDVCKVGAFSSGTFVAILDGTGAGTTTLHSASAPFSSGMISPSPDGNSYLSSPKVKLNLSDGTVFGSDGSVHINSVSSDGTSATLNKTIPATFTGTGSVDTIPWNPATVAPFTWTLFQQMLNIGSAYVGTLLGTNGTGLGIVPAHPGLVMESNIANNATQWFGSAGDNPGGIASLTPGEGTSSADDQSKWTDAAHIEAYARPIATNQFDPARSYPRSAPGSTSPGGGVSTYGYDSFASGAQMLLNMQANGCLAHTKTRLDGTGNASKPWTPSSLFDDWRLRETVWYLLCDRGLLLMEVTKDETDPISDATQWKIYRTVLGAPTGPSTSSIQDNLVTGSGTFTRADGGSKAYYRVFAKGACVYAEGNDSAFTLTLPAGYSDFVSGAAHGTTVTVNPGDALLLQLTSTIRYKHRHHPGGGIRIFKDQ